MTKEAAHKEFTSFLKKGDNRITPERFEVLDHAMDYKGHFGADELYIKMRTSNSDISRATVYNTVELLAQCGLVVKRNFGENKTRYESIVNKKLHDHLICTNCGTIKEFSEPKIQKIVKELSVAIGFEPDSYSLNIYGKCTNPNCGQIKNAK